MEENQEIADEQSADIEMGFIGSLNPTFEDDISDLLLQQLGSSNRGYRRETRTAHRRIVSEIYSRRGSRRR